MFPANPPFRSRIYFVMKFCFVFIFMSACYSRVTAQCDNVMNPPMYAAAKSCQFYSQTFTLAGPGVQGTEAITWSVTLLNPPVPMGNLSSIGLAFTAVGTSCTISGIPTLTGSFNIQLVANCNTANCFACGAGADCSGCASAITRTITLGVTNARDPVDVMLVLDVSGSMLQSIPGYSLNKWGVVKESVQAFLEDYKNWGTCDDRIGVTYFDHRRFNFRSGGLMFFNKAPDGPIPLIGPGSIMEDMNAKSPGTMTCMGGGMLAGYAAFDGMHPHRNMILFTDGLQNMEPMVSQASGTRMVIDDYNMRSDGTGFPAPPLDLKAPSLPFRTYAVGIGDNAVTTLLTEISQAPANAGFDGEVFPINSTVNLAATLSAAFTQTFVEALSQFSPQLIDIRKMNVTNSGSTKFVVNRSADKLLIRIVADPGPMAEARIRIEKDGRDLSRLLRRGGQTYRSIFLDTTLVKQYQVSLAGDWNITITGASASYQIICMINDEALEATANLGNRGYAPGDTIQLEASLQYSGQPLDNATLAAVWIARPGQDVNDLFSSAPAPDVPSGFPTEKDNDPGQSKYEALIALNSQFVSALEPVSDSINLNAAPGGKYQGAFSDTRESGIYKFLFRLAGNDTLTGAYERFILRSTVVDFGQADLNASIFEIVIRDGQQYFLITPRNRFNHLLGPNRLNQVRLLVKDKPVQLIDKLDGSYEAMVPDFSFPDADPEVVVDIKGDTFFSGDYSDIQGSNVPFWDKYRLLILIIVLLVLFILLVVFWLRKRVTP